MAIKPKALPKRLQEAFDEFQREQKQKELELKRLEELMTPEEIEELERQKYEESIQQVLKMVFSERPMW